MLNPLINQQMLLINGALKEDITNRGMHVFFLFALQVGVSFM